MVRLSPELQHSACEEGGQNRCTHDLVSRAGWFAVLGVGCVVGGDTDVAGGETRARGSWAVRDDAAMPTSGTLRGRAFGCMWDERWPGWDDWEADRIRQRVVVCKRGTVTGRELSSGSSECTDRRLDEFTLVPLSWCSSTACCTCAKRVRTNKQ